MSKSSYEYYIDKDNLSFRFSCDDFEWERLNSFGDWVSCEVTIEEEARFAEVND